MSERTEVSDHVSELFSDTMEKAQQSWSTAKFKFGAEVADAYEEGPLCNHSTCLHVIALLLEQLEHAAHQIGQTVTKEYALSPFWRD